MRRILVLIIIGIMLMSTGCASRTVINEENYPKIINDISKYIGKDIEITITDTLSLSPEGDNLVGEPNFDSTLNNDKTKRVIVKYDGVSELSETTDLKIRGKIEDMIQVLWEKAIIIKAENVEIINTKSKPNNEEKKINEEDSVEDTSNLQEVEEEQSESVSNVDDVSNNDTNTSNQAEDVIKVANIITDAYKTINDYLIGIDDMSNQVYSGEYMYFIEPYLSTNSAAWEFWEENGIYLSGYRGSSEIDSINLEEYELSSKDDGLTRIQINVKEKWVFANGQEETFTNEYSLVNINDAWIIDDIKMEELKEFIISYEGNYPDA